MKSNINLAIFTSDDRYKSPKKNDLLDVNNDFTKNFYIFLKQASSYFFKAKMFWIIIFVLPMFIIIINQMILGLTSELITKFPKSLVTWIFITPILFICVLTLPSFITGLRETNNLKRMKMIGINKGQFYIFYMLFSFVLVVMIILILVFPIYYFESIFASKIINHDIDQYKIFNAINFNAFILLMFLGTIAISSMGYYLGMKVKSSKTIYLMGSGIWIFTMFCLGFSSLFEVELYKYFLQGGFWSNIGVLILFVAKYMFILTPFTLIFYAITIATNYNILLGSVDGLYNFIVFFSLIISISVIIFIRVNKIGNYESGR